VESKPQHTPTETTKQQPSRWEALLDGCDGFCCRPLFGEEAYETGSVDGGSSETPSEIYISLESSKTLVTV